MQLKSGEIDHLSKIINKMYDYGRFSFKTKNNKLNRN